ncbi:MAG: hypothetical protein GWN55_16215 [Phycisphaerae bacterium]|nr:hypothetical protein [Phycisphaerae bacterium]NIR67613.1 hypothetical protein [candidate division Zixibacteria bacterium]NIW49953.1 hypothetical protein [Gammaproteobacteria bacterium]NIP54177.1 hypothetical protein [Phycisphaerae bacterium]NIS53086.1 hypothetical protein [Phycisphaerae bacterium]
MNQKLIVVGLVCGALGFVVGFAGGAILNRPARKNYEAKIADIHNESAQFKNEIKTLQQHIRKLTVELKKRETIVLREKQKLAQIYDNLHDYKHGTNDVKIKYIRSFSIRGNEITIQMQNNTSENVGPNARLLFLNKEGLITNDYRLWWIISTIAPGETRIEKGKINFRFGEPAYYTIEFEPYSGKD